MAGVFPRHLQQDCKTQGNEHDFSRVETHIVFRLFGTTAQDSLGEVATMEQAFCVNCNTTPRIKSFKTISKVESVQGLTLILLNKIITDGYLKYKHNERFFEQFNLPKEVTDGA